MTQLQDFQINVFAKRRFMERPHGIDCKVSVFGDLFNNTAQVLSETVIFYPLAINVQITVLAVDLVNEPQPESISVEFFTVRPAVNYPITRTGVAIFDVAEISRYRKPSFRDNMQFKLGEFFLSQFFFSFSESLDQSLKIARPAEAILVRPISSIVLRRNVWRFGKWSACGERWCPDLMSVVVSREGARIKFRYEVCKFTAQDALPVLFLGFTSNFPMAREDFCLTDPFTGLMMLLRLICPEMRRSYFDTVLRIASVIYTSNFNIVLSAQGRRTIKLISARDGKSATIVPPGCVNSDNLANLYTKSTSNSHINTLWTRLACEPYPAISRGNVSWDDTGHFPCEPDTGKIKVILTLQIEPKLCACPEVTAKTQRGIGCNCPLAANDLLEPVTRYMQFFGKRSRRQSVIRQKVLGKDLTGMDRADNLSGGHCFSPLVVIDNFNFISIAFVPDKADAPLAIDPDGMLSLPVSLERFQMVRRRHAKVIETYCGVKLGKPTLSPLHKIGWKTFHPLSRTQRPNPFVFGRSYHSTSVSSKDTGNKDIPRLREESNMSDEPSNARPDAHDSYFPAVATRRSRVERPLRVERLLRGDRYWPEPLGSHATAGGAEARPSDGRTQ